MQSRVAHPQSTFDTFCPFVESISSSIRAFAACRSGSPDSAWSLANAHTALLISWGTTAYRPQLLMRAAVHVTRGSKAA